MFLYSPGSQSRRGLKVGGHVLWKEFAHVNTRNFMSQHKTLVMAQIRVIFQVSVGLGLGTRVRVGMGYVWG